MGWGVCTPAALYSRVNQKRKDSQLSFWFSLFSIEDRDSWMLSLCVDDGGDGVMYFISLCMDICMHVCMQCALASRVYVNLYCACMQM